MKSVKFIALEIFALYSITHHNDSIAVMMDFVLLPSESRLLQTQQQPQNGVPKRRIKFEKWEYPL